MDKERSEVCLHYARELELQLIVCVPDERLQSLIRNVDCVYGFRRHQNQVSMMHIDKGDYLDMVEGDREIEESFRLELKIFKESIKEDGKTVSIRDTFVKKPTKENFYHGLLLGISRIQRKLVCHVKQGIRRWIQ